MNRFIGWTDKDHEIYEEMKEAMQPLDDDMEETETEEDETEDEPYPYDGMR